MVRCALSVAVEPYLAALDVAANTTIVLSTAAGYVLGISPDNTQVAFIEQEPGVAELSVVRVSGATPAVPQLEYPGGTGGWVDSSTLVLTRYGTQAPYAALDGVYRVVVGP